VRTTTFSPVFAAKNSRQLMELYIKTWIWIRAYL